MTAFEFLSVAISFVLGLAVTLLLTSLLAAFRQRRQARMDWLPFLWAAYVLAFQFQFWWTLWKLVALPQWTVATFGLLLSLAALLFLAGGLVLPSGSGYPSDLGTYFDEDGRWGVAALAGYNVLGTLGNVTLFGASLLGTLHYLMLAETVLGLLVVFAPGRRTRIVVTLLFGVLLFFSIVRATTFAYDASY
jgi:hypothetical protein